MTWPQEKPSRMRFVFLHGGPGFNSFAERAILDPLFASSGHEIIFWNEPSRLRPDGEGFEKSEAYERWLASAEGCVVSAAQFDPVHLIAHSVGVHAALDIVRLHPACVRTLVVVAPSADSFATFTNVLRLAQEDLRDVKPHVASTIAECLARTRSLFDDAMREGLMNVLQDEQLFTHYWADRGQFEASMSALAQPEAQFDAESFFAVLAGFAQRGATFGSSAEVNLPTFVLFGARDRITPVAEQRSAIEAAIPGAHIEVLDGCSHYAHLDRPGYFVDVVAAWASAHS
jgi:pimeloyl-ACP methyl ester carboxylesterase